MNFNLMASKLLLCFFSYRLYKHLNLVAETQTPPRVAMTGDVLRLKDSKVNLFSSPQHA
jgi:hypothetical protein